jgi:hypothetical protein
VKTETGKQNLTLVDVVITMCADGSYCCGFNATNCCEKKAGYWITNGKVTGHNGSAPQPFLLEDAVESDLGARQSQSTLKLALGLGLGLGLVFVGLLAANLWFLLHRRRSPAEEIRQPPTTEERRSSGNPKGIHQETYLKGVETDILHVELEQPIAELYQPTPELEESELLVEMDASPQEPGPNELAGAKKS